MIVVSVMSSDTTRITPTTATSAFAIQRTAAGAPPPSWNGTIARGYFEDRIESTTSLPNSLRTLS